jgi:hypothetical protein
MHSLHLSVSRNSTLIIVTFARQLLVVNRNLDSRLNLELEFCAFPSILIPTEDFKGHVAFEFRESHRHPSSNLITHRNSSRPVLGTMNLRMLLDHSASCSPDEAVDTSQEFELGLHIAALVAILLTSTFGNHHAALN